MNTLAKKAKRLNLVWIKAHVGHEGNEAADGLAKQATTMIQTNEFPLPQNLTKTHIGEKIYEEWNKQWSQEPTCRQTRQFIKQVNPSRSKNTLKLARSQLTLLVGLITGHNNLAYHASKEDPDIFPMCCMCGENLETFHHFATECPSLRESRNTVFLDKKIEDTWKPEDLLEFARIPAIEVLLDR